MEWTGVRAGMVGFALACMLLAAACSRGSDGGTVDSGGDAPGDSGPRLTDVSGDLVEPGDLDLMGLPDGDGDAADSGVGEVDAAIDTNELILQPVLTLDPPDKIHFGLVAQGWTIERTLSIRNTGKVALTIELLEISENTDGNEFTLVEDEDFEPTLGEGTSGILLPDDEVELVFSFTNNGPGAGSVTGEVHIASDDPALPEVYLDMVATRDGEPNCMVTLLPPKLDFGSVPHSGNKTEAIMLANTGSGYCSIQFVTVRECVSWMGLMTMCDASAGPSPFFSHGDSPPPMADNLAPGAAFPVPVTFKPPTEAPWLPIFEEYHAVFQVAYSEEYSNPGEVTQHLLPQPDRTGQLNWNLQGASGLSSIECMPQQLNLGVFLVGCSSPPTCVEVQSAGTAPLHIDDAYLEGCDEVEFQLDSGLQLPIEIEPSASADVCIVYHPQNEGPDACQLVIVSSDEDKPIHKVLLEGTGATDTSLIEEFPQIAEGRTDILFVMDESPSMFDAALKMKEAFDELAAGGKQWTGDLQIGVTVIDIADLDEEAGKLQGVPRIYTASTVAWFADTLLGITAAPAGGQQESGLEAARRALTPPLINDSDVACGCPEDQLCPGQCMEGDLCVDGKCGGYNRGFLRPDASLLVVFFADEEDQSPGSVPFYIDFFKSIKGIYNEDLFQAFAIVGDFNGGCSIAGEYGADAGKRYIEVQQATGGKFTSVCAYDDYSNALEEIWQAAQGATTKQFLLSGIPKGDDTTVSIVSGLTSTPCSTGWQYDEDSNSIIVNEDGPCMPEPGESLKVEYTLGCF